MSLPSYRCSLYHVVVKKVCGTSRLHLTIDMAWEARNRRHKTARARIRLLLFETAVYCVSAANNCLGEVQESFI